MSVEIKSPAPVWPHPMAEGYTVTYRFTSGGVDYFSLTDQFNTYSQRGLSAMQIYDEWQNRMTHDTMKLFVQAMQEELDPADGKIKISKIAQLILYMKERIEWPIPTSELFYKMASVGVFDASESPLYYDVRYNNEVKIPHWKSNGVDTFFLCESLKNLVPLPSIAEPVLRELQKIVDEAAAMQSKSLPNPLPKDSGGMPIMQPQPALG